MMTRKKRWLITFLILFIILGALGGVFAYFYFTTDLLKSNQTLFWEYASQNTKIEQWLDTNWWERYQAKKESNPYTDKGEVTLSCQNIQDQEILNDMKLTLTGSSNRKEQKQSQVIQLKKGENVYFELEYLKDKQKYALKSDEVVTKYVSIENTKLKELGTKLEIKNSQKSPDKIEAINRQAWKQLPQEEKQKIKNLYQKVVKEQISENHYQKQKEVSILVEGQNHTVNQYTLTLSEIEVSNVMIKLLETTKSNEQVISLLEQMTNGSFSSEQIQSYLEEMIANLKKQEVTEKQAIEITVYEEAGKVIETVLQTANNKIEFILSESTDKNKIVVNQYQGENQLLTKWELEKPKNLIQYVLIVHFYEGGQEHEKVIAKLEMSNDLNANSLSSSFVIGRNAQNHIVQISYTNQKNFVNTVEIESLDNTNSVVLNQYTKEEAQNLISAIQDRLEQVYTDKVATLGLAGNPYFAADVVITNIRNLLKQQTSENQNQFDQQMIYAFNSKFEVYKNVEKNDKTLLGILKTLQDNNKNYEKDETKKVSLRINDIDYGYLENREVEKVVEEIKKIGNNYQMNLLYHDQTKRINVVQLVIQSS